MTLKAFNIAILLGWLMALGGGLLYDVAAGLVGGGLLLLAITAWVVRLGGIVVPPPKAKQETEDHDVSQ